MAVDHDCHSKGQHAGGSRQGVQHIRAQAVKIATCWSQDIRRKMCQGLGDKVDNLMGPGNMLNKVLEPGNAQGAGQHSGPKRQGR